MPIRNTGIYVPPTVFPLTFELTPVLINFTPQRDIDYKNVHITDFGIAYTTQLVNNTGGHTRVRGCVEYLAPEILYLQAPDATSMSDMWTVGVMGYEICLGQELDVTAETFREIRAYLEGQPLDLWRIPQRFPQSVHQIIQTCMAKDPRQRFNARGLSDFIRGQLTILGADENNTAENATVLDHQWRSA